MKIQPFEFSTRYNPKETEDKWIHYWQEHHLFSAKANPKKKSFCIVIPPPNVTGILHMGHALNNTLQDILIRYKRMRGFECLWMPGTDHAGIATQNVVEKKLAKEGKTRQEIGRENFLKYLWEWKNEYGDTIIHQLKKLGSSCDWQRTRFTMDEQYSKAVRYVFVKLYEKGLIYRGQYIINWCPRCQTALSDEEAEHQETQGRLYHIRYPFKDTPQEYIVVATTRPETMLGDTAVAVHPKDKRYKKFVGKTLILPLIGREIKIINDEFVDPEFGTGAVKVTPAHDPNDFEMGLRHHLASINILQPDGKLNENAGRFHKMDRFQGRASVIEALQKEGLLEKIEPHLHAVGHCYRCHTMVEPYLSRQWFVKMAPLAQDAIEVVKKRKIKFTPSRWTKVYLNWMENIRDWCISRQIWWGHRIPVWYCRDCEEGKNLIVSLETPSECPRCHSKDLIQEEDVLDTWFSSWLWPFATFSWPEKDKDLDFFYPTSTLFTAPEIIFFWVARMIMAGLEFMGDIPFSNVYIHGTVRDAKGRKMSKSLGNAIDPLDIIEEYGTDALRFSLILNSGQDLFISREKFEIGRNFANKIWNASRLILMNLSENLPPETKLTDGIEGKSLDLPSRWILSKFHSTLDKTEKAIEKYRFSEAENLIYDFFWKNLCDWYLEIVKGTMIKEETQLVLLRVLKDSLKILHPFVPFVTEEIWEKISPGQPCLTISQWPVFDKKMLDKEAEDQMQTLIEIITSVRNIRSQWHVPPQTKVDSIFHAPDKKSETFLGEISDIIKTLGKIQSVCVKRKLSPPKDSAMGRIGKINFYIRLEGIIDLNQEKNRISKEIENLQRITDNLALRLKNKDFLQRAPKDIVNKEKMRLVAAKEKLTEFKKTLQEIA